MQLDGRSALITGAGSGIGRALAIAAAREGMTVALVGRRKDALEETRRSLPDPEQGIVLPADITDAAGRRRLRHDVGAAFGRLDLLVNNAGVQSVGTLDETGDADIDAMLRTNLGAPMALTRTMLDLLRAAAPSRIVNIGSMFGLIGFPLFSVYSATKFGLRGFSDALRRELKDDGIGVTFAAPRATATAAMDGSQHLVKPFGMRIDRPEAVAARILKAVKRDARSVYPAGPERLFLLLQALRPGVIDGALVRQLRGVQPGGTARSL
jgi:short-subunit dehydrogenase